MVTVVLSTFWILLVLVVAVLAVRQVRAGRREPVEFDRLRHQAAAEADMNATMRGPNGMSQGWF